MTWSAMTRWMIWNWRERMPEQSEIGEKTGRWTVPADWVQGIANRAAVHGLVCEVSLSLPEGRVDETQIHPAGLPLSVRVCRE